MPTASERLLELSALSSPNPARLHFLSITQASGSVQIFSDVSVELMADYEIIIDQDYQVEIEPDITVDLIPDLEVELS